MILGTAFQKKPWHIPKKTFRALSTQKIDEMLGLINRACEGSFYMADYFNEKLLIGDSSLSTFSGYSRALVEKEGFDFYRRILQPDEYNWMQKMAKEAANVLYSYPEPQRKNMEFTYDLKVTTINDREITIRYKLVPFELDENGNLWLGLMFASQQFSVSIGPKAIIDNYKTGERYDFVNGKFVLLETKSLTSDETTILKWIANGISGKNMCDLLKISERSLRRKERSAFDKLGADTPAEAVYKAVTLGII
jgi:DNA-binding CsgD family transcriptional regulator